MPQGPGDDILDSIESGTADDQVMSKFKINADQLKAFKSLHYGLSNQKMNYNEIEDYYPELSSYFKGGSPQQKPDNGIGKPDFTKTAHEPKISESTARTDQAKVNEQVVAVPKPAKTTYELFADKTAKATKNIINETRSNDDVVEKMIREGRYNNYKLQKENQLANTPGSDMPTTASDQDVSRLIEPEVKPQDMPVTPGDIAKEKESIGTNENHARLFLRTLAKDKPEKAKDLQADTYYLDVAKSMQYDPANRMRINKALPNVEKIKDGELVYDIKTGHLLKPENPLQSLLTGWQQKSKLFDDYQFMTNSDDKTITNELEKRRKAYDPDEPTPMPENTVAEITQGIGGMPLKATATGLVLGAIPGTQEVAPFASAAVGSADFYKMAYAGSLQQSYNEFRNKGDDEQTALAKAKDLAIKSGLTDAAMGAAMSLIGGRIAEKPLPKLNFSAGYRTAAASILNNAGHAVANNIGEGLLIGGLSGASQMAKNKFAQAAGIDRNIDEGVGESIESNLLLTLGMSAAMKLGKGLNPNTYKTLLNGMSRIEPERLNTVVDDHVKTGEITKEEGDNVKSEVADHRAIDQTIPDNITEEARIEIQDKIKKRQKIEDETKQKLEETDKSYHAAIKEKAKIRTDKINEDILELSKDKKSKEELKTEKQQENESKTEAETQTETGNGGLLTEQQTHPGAADKVEEPAAPDKITDKSGNQFRIIQKSDEKGHVTISLIDDSGEYTKNNVKGDKSVANLELLNDQNGYYPQGISVNKELRRKGIATLLFRFAENKFGKLKETTDLSPEGQKFYESYKQSQIANQKPIVRHWQNPETGQKFILREDKLFTVDDSGKETEFSEKAMKSTHVQDIIQQIKSSNNAIPEQSAEGVHVPASSGDSHALGQGNESQGPVAETSAGPQEVNSAQKRFYETAIGAAPQQHHLIEVDPIVGGTPKKLKEIIGDVSKGLKQRMLYSKTSKGAGGSYLPSFKGIKIRYNGDLNVTAHEMGHSIDDQFNFYNEALKSPTVLNELNQFTNQGLASNPPANHPNPAKYIMNEGIAEWFRGFVIDPVKAEQLAPETTALYRSLVSKDFQKVIKNFSDDFRTWRGSTGRDITLANVDFEPNSKGLLAKLFKKEETNNDFSISWVDRLATLFINPLHATEKAFNYAKGIRGLDEVLPENDFMILSRILNGVDGKFGEILKNGMINAEGEVLKTGGGVMLYDQKGALIKESGTVKNLKWLLEPFDNTDSGSIEHDMKDTIAYMISERVVDDLSKNLERGEILTGIGGGVISDFGVAQKTLNEFENGDPAKLARIKEAASRYREIADDMLRYAVDKGRMSEDQYNLIKENNTQYVALQRLIETEPGEELIVYQKQGGKSLGSKGEITHKIKGSTKAIQNPYTSLLDSLYKTIRESDRNDTLRAFRDMLIDPRDMNQGSPKRLSDIGVLGKAGDKQSIPIFIDGKPEHWIFQKDIYENIKGMDKEAYRLPGLITAPAKAMRFFTTHFPTFAVRNWVKDLQDRIIKTTTGSGFKELVGNREDWNAIARAGGLNSGQYLKSKEHYYGLLTEAMDGMAKDKGIHLLDPVRLKHLWHNYEDLLYKGETSNRVAEYRSAFKEAQKKGMDNYNAGMYAAFKARDLIDFAVMGHWMKVANQIVPFSNAAVQGLRSAAVSIKKDWKGFLGRTLAYSIAPGIAAWVWNHRNDEDSKMYEELPAYQRDMFWNFHIGANKWISIPKPYELSLPSAGIDRALSYHYTDNKKAFEGYSKDIIKLLSPFDEGNLAGPYQAIIEGYGNYDFFREHTIIPPDEDALKLSRRHTETASRLGQFLQSASEKAFGLFGNSGIDARKWDHFLLRQFSYAGNFALKLSDIGVEKGRHEFDLSDTGLFKRSPAYNSVSVQDMIQFAKGNGLTKSPPYKAFNKLVGKYFNADTDEEREEIGKELIDYSKNLMEEWKKRDIAEYQEKRAEAKKAAQKK